MEKYGFVYIWYDRHHKRYYIGMHWGAEDDGYICSSSWMMQAYIRRTRDFKRRILERVYTSRKDLYDRELYWLSMIKDEELKKRYYNLKKTVNDAWLNDENVKSIKEKISITLKEKFKNDEIFRKQYYESQQSKDFSWCKDEQVKQKRSQSISKTCSKRETYYKNLPPTNPVGSEEYSKVMSDIIKERWKDPEYKKRVRPLISEGLKGKPRESSRLPWWTDGINNKRQIDCPGDGWRRGRTTKEMFFSEEERKRRSERGKLKTGIKYSDERKQKHSEAIKQWWAERKGTI